MIIQEKKIIDTFKQPIFDNENWLLFDIETTGFDRKKTQVVLVGMIYRKKGDIILKQIFSEQTADEPLLLTELLRDFRDKEILISYNGERFDIPYLNARYRENHIYYKIPMYKSFDIFLYFKDNRRVYNLPDVKLKTVEKVLGIHRDDTISGKDSVRLYYDYKKSGSDELRQKILLHNHDDIYNLLDMTEKALNLDIMIRQYTPKLIHLGGLPAYISRCDSDEQLIVFTFEPDQELPPYHQVENHFLIDTVSKHRILHLPILRFHSNLDEFVFIDPDRLIGESFDQMSATEKEFYLIMTNDLIDYRQLEKIVNKKTDII
jgi:uncharacterized protein YprB with RNaseH-like and TPR domain